MEFFKQNFALEFLIGAQRSKQPHFLQINKEKGKEALKQISTPVLLFWCLGLVSSVMRMLLLQEFQVLPKTELWTQHKLYLLETLRFWEIHIDFRMPSLLSLFLLDSFQVCQGRQMSITTFHSPQGFLFVYLHFGTINNNIYFGWLTH